MSTLKQAPDLELIGEDVETDDIDEIYDGPDIGWIEPWHDEMHETYHGFVKQLNARDRIYLAGTLDETEMRAMVLAHVQKQARGHLPIFDRSAVWYPRDGKLWTPWEISDTTRLLDSWGRQQLFWVGEPKDAKRMPVKNVRGIARGFEDATRREHQFYENAPFGIAINDQFHRADLVRRELTVEPLSEQHRQTDRIELEPHPEGEAMLERILSNWFPDPDDPALILLLEFLGISILGLATAYEKALVFYGPPGTGKSSVLSFVARALPKAMFSTVKLEKMGARFEDIDLVRARINMCSELSDRQSRGTTIEHPDDIKALITGDERQFERKYQDPFVAKPRAGHVFAVNPGCFPRVSGADTAFRERWVCCPFMNRIRGTKDDIKDIYKQAHIYGHALVMRCLDAARQVIERNAYTDCPEGRAILNEKWFVGMDTVSHFVSECLEPRKYKYEGLSPTEMNQAYGDFCRRRGYQFPFTGAALEQALERQGVMRDEKPVQGSIRYSHRRLGEF